MKKAEIIKSDTSNINNKEDRVIPLRINFSWTLIGNIISSASKWAVLIIIAKLGSPKMVGTFGLALAVTTPIFMLCNLGLRTVQSTDAQGQFTFGDYLSNRLVTTALGIILLMGLVILGDYDFETTIVISIMGLSKVFESISDVIYGQMQKNEQMDLIAISSILKSIISLLAIYLIIILSKNIILGVAGFAISSLIILILYDLKKVLTWWDRKIRFNLTNFFDIVKLSLPIGLVNLVNSLNTNIPRYSIEKFMGLEELGYFTALAYVLVAGGTVVGALGQSASPRLAKLFAKNDYIGFKKLLLKLMFLGALIGSLGLIIVFLAGKNILTIFYTSDYAKYNYVFIWLMASATLMYIGGFFGTALTSMRCFNIQVPINVLTCVIILLLSYILIPIYGLVGAAWAIMGSMFCKIIINGVMTYRLLRAHSTY